jgi:3-deoxy-7-phosphoheptulonate synthase
MIESHLRDGNQKLTRGGEGLEYGVSITDACIDWDTTATLLQDLAEKLRGPLLQRLTTEKAAASS